MYIRLFMMMAITIRIVMLSEFESHASHQEDHNHDQKEEYNCSLTIIPMTFPSPTVCIYITSRRHKKSYSNMHTQTTSQQVLPVVNFVTAQLMSHAREIPREHTYSKLTNFQNMHSMHYIIMYV